MTYRLWILVGELAKNMPETKGNLVRMYGVASREIAQHIRNHQS
jgi:hypothetical protein